ncbi:hypothetical protein [Catenulispora yoronensis]|uniref:hypothetical protein n=1 Tax=Catenulispora yoronensis TaxID=450799 RepID=UPI0031D4E6FD
MHDAETIVRLAWRRDLYAMRGLAEEQLEAAIADSLQAYEALRQAQRDSIPGRIADAHARFEAATRLTRTKTDNRDRINELIASDAGDGSAPSAVLPAVIRVLSRVRRLAATVRSRIRPPDRAGRP